MRYNKGFFECMLILFCFIAVKTIVAQKLNTDSIVDYLPFLEEDNATSFFEEHCKTIPIVGELVPQETEVYSYSDFVSFKIDSLGRTLSVKRIKGNSKKIWFSIDSNELELEFEQVGPGLDFSRIDGLFYRKKTHEFAVLKVPLTIYGTDYRVCYFIIDINNKVAFDYWSLPLKNFFIVEKGKTLLFPVYREERIEVYDGKIRYGIIELHPYEKD